MFWSLRPRRAVAIDTAVLARLQLTQPWLRGLDAQEQVLFCELMAEFLTRKTLSAAQGLILDDTMRIAIAAQACLPILRLGLSHYDDFSEIVVHPGAFKVRRTLVDEIGLVTEVDDMLAGEAMAGGPVILSWDDIDPAQALPGTNLVIHEFAHKLDLADGIADGCPPLPSSLRRIWLPTLEAAYEQLCQQLDDIERAIPPDVDPESVDADPWYAELAMDPYATTDLSEFFAVASEAFFVAPVQLHANFPELCNNFATLYGQDTLARATL
jgi:Mlc titration factor MtfA (ptsG expression regulator)